MNTPRQPRLEPPPMRRSTKVALVLLGTAGVVGVGAMGYDAWQKAHAHDAAASTPQPGAPPITTAQTYNNNDFIPGIGYYHAPYHGWFPFPYNYYDPGRGYFAGGLWQAAPYVANLFSSRPSDEAVAAALAARRAREQAEQQQQRQAQSSSSGYTSHFRGTGGTGSGSYSASRPSSSPAPSSGSHSIQRGGFGSSGHSSGGAS